jgi:hypothetical protein
MIHIVAQKKYAVLPGRATHRVIRTSNANTMKPVMTAAFVVPHVM